MNKNIIIIGILATCLLLTVGYIAINVYQERQMQRDRNMYNDGFVTSYNEVVSNLFELAITCQQIPIELENNTINLIAVECLQE